MAFTEEQRGRLAALYEANQARVFRICMRILRDPEEAADACQEVFIIAGRELFAGAPPRSIDVWLRTVARNHCVDLLRRRNRLTGLLPTIAIGEIGGEDPEAATVARQHVGSILRALSPRERTALWQSAVESLPLADIAKDLRMNYMAAAQVLSRARRHAAMAIARAAAAVITLPFLRRVVMQAGAQRLRLPAGASHVAALVALPLLVAAVQSSSYSSNEHRASPSTSSLVAPGPGAAGSSAGQVVGRLTTQPAPESKAGPTLPAAVGAPASVAPATSAVVKIVDGIIRQAPSAPPLPFTPPLPAPSVRG